MVEQYFQHHEKGTAKDISDYIKDIEGIKHTTPSVKIITSLLRRNEHPYLDGNGIRIYIKKERT